MDGKRHIVPGEDAETREATPDKGKEVITSLESRNASCVLPQQAREIQISRRHLSALLYRHQQQSQRTMPTPPLYS